MLWSYFMLYILSFVVNRTSDIIGCYVANCIVFKQKVSLYHAEYYRVFLCSELSAWRIYGLTPSALLKSWGFVEKTSENCTPFHMKKKKSPSSWKHSPTPTYGSVGWSSFQHFLEVSGNKFPLCFSKATIINL